MAVPRVTDRELVHAVLNRDRDWAAYALGDLTPGFAEHCEWFVSEPSAETLLLLYRGFDPPILFAMGHAHHLEALVEEANAPQVSLHVRPDAQHALSPAYDVSKTYPMLRMSLRPTNFKPVAQRGIFLVAENDAEAVMALYADGHEQGEGPTFFNATMLRQGTFRGVREDGHLIAIAGTHLYSSELGVAAVGNVYTRRDYRGRGLAARVTSAVVEDAIIRGVTTIVLNVAPANEGARRVYERLGFETYCRFFEGPARRRVNEPILAASMPHRS
jgi:ribosomal protein S18 acetylase RimI-like enzyme